MATRIWTANYYIQMENQKLSRMFLYASAFLKVFPEDKRKSTTVSPCFMMQFCFYDSDVTNFGAS